ncbi:MAG: hypothetical protein HPY82_23955 [Gammaproteobacteria bacterium]|nr:hypothetical protein [Gammaproteobacteria bacterium]
MSTPFIRRLIPGVASLVLSAWLAGCGQAPVVGADSAAQDRAASDAAGRDTFTEIDPVQLKKDADALMQRAGKENSVALLQDAAVAYEQLLQLAPEDNSLQYQLYDIYYRLAASGADNVEPRLRALFATLPAPLREAVRPPSLALFLQRYEKSEASKQYDDDSLVGLLLAAMQEQPTEPATYLLLADSYLRTRHPALAIATVKQALAYSPDNPASHKYLGQAYRSFVRSQSCIYSYRDEIQKAAESLRIASSQLPDDLKIRELLVDVYSLMNLAPLSANEARKLHAERPDDVSSWLLAQSLSDISQYEKSDELYQTLAARYPDVMYEALAGNAALQGKWDTASQHWAQHFYYSRQPAFYAALVRSVSDEQAYGNAAAMKIFAVLTEHMDASPWQTSLREFRLGRLAADQLVASAVDTCERTEAFFYAGYAQKTQGNKRKAAEYFQAAVNEKAYSYKEYAMARYFLAQ